jgi:CHAT domain-containing protein/tetratricopeptide (TPR) repeat protein
LLAQGNQALARGETEQGIGLLMQALSKSRELHDKVGEVTALNNLGDICRLGNVPGQALLYYKQALPLMKETGGQRGESLALNNIGLTYLALKQPEPALQSFRAALAITQELADKFGSATILKNMAQVYDAMSQPKQVVALSLEALALWRGLKDKGEEAGALTTIGTAYYELGQTKLALSYLKQAWPLRRAVRDIGGEATTVNNLGAVYYSIGQKTQALQLYLRALPLYQRVGDKSGEASAFGNLGHVYRDMHQSQLALEYMNRALAIDEEIGDKETAARTLSDIGSVYRRQWRPQMALQMLHRALTLQTEQGDKVGAAHTLNTLGMLYDDESNPLEAMQYYEQALPVFKAAGDRRGEATTLSGMAQAQNHCGQGQQALQLLNQALILYREVGDKAGEAAALTNIGEVNDRHGEPQAALRYYNQALKLQRATDNVAGRASTLNNIGTLYLNHGQPLQALIYLDEALQLHRRKGDSDGEAVTLSNIGQVYSTFGRPEQTIIFDQQALKLQQAVGDIRGQATSLNNIGAAYHTLGQLEKALAYYKQSLELATSAGDTGSEATTLNNIGAIFSDREQPQPALDYYERALAKHRENGDKAGEVSALNNLGNAHAGLKHPEQSLDYARKALTLASAIGYKEGQAIALSNMSSAEYVGGDLDLAAAHQRASLALYEEMREALGGLSGAKISFLESNLVFYHFYVHLLLRQDKQAEAFAWAQKSKARGVLDLLVAKRFAMDKNATPQERATDTALKQRIADINRQLVAAAIDARPDAARAARLHEQLRQAEEEQRRFTVALYAKYPAMGKKRVGETATLAEVAHALPPNAALLDYIVLRTRDIDETMLFCLTREAGQPVLSVHPIVDAGTQQPMKQSQLAALVKEFDSACSDPKGEPGRRGAELETLLLGPVARQLTGKKQLFICPDGPLWSVPFQALPTTPARPQSQFLAERYAISYGYSATTLLATLTGNRARGKQPRQSLLVLANPQFDDLRIKHGTVVSAGKSTSQGTTRPIGATARAIPATSRAIGATSRAIGATARELYTGSPRRLSPLPGTQVEAAALRVAFPDAVVKTGVHAQEATVKSAARRFRYLHFATHGFFNESSPLLSCIALARPDSHSTDDGFLTAREILDMDWNNDMVVLSACDTGRGGAIGGEGMIGLTWALLVAGVPTQVVSQWQVDDVSTAELMKQFYLRLQRGDSKSAALQAAEIKVMHDGKHRHPYYWAPFILMGDWRN